MIVDGNWVDPEDWLIERLRIICQTYNEISEAISNGQLTESEARNALRYIRELEWIDKTPDEYWQSSSFYC